MGDNKETMCGQQLPGLLQEECCQQVEILSLYLVEARPVLCAVLGSPVQEGRGFAGVRPAQARPQRWWRFWSILPMKRVWESLVCPACRREFSRISYWYIKIPHRSEEQGDTFFSIGLSDKTRGSEHLKVNLKTRKMHVCCGEHWTLPWAAQRSCGVSVVGKNQNLARHSPWAIDSTCTCLRRV